MGKSPGKWIKTLLLGKKSSKSNAVKGREKAGNQKEVLVAARAPEDDAIPILPAVSRPTVTTTEGNERRLEIETSETTNLQSDGGAALQGHQDTYSRGSTPQGAMSDPEIERKDKAATIAQAAFRGYLARRAFKALKGIIRLQALIRGHLVRRQAVATLCCVLGIVKLQALARGRKVRYSSIGKEINEKYNLVKTQDGKHSNYEGRSMFIKEAKMSGNAFVRKLVSSSPIVMSLRLYYDSEEPNSVPNWLGRWSSSCFWKPVPQPKKISHSKTQKKFGNGPVVDSESGRPKRSVRRVPAANVDSTLVSASSEDKPKRSNLRKVSTHPADAAQENSQNEFEKVKRNLRKVHNPIIENPVQPEIDAEKPKSSRKVQNPIIENPVQPEIDAEKPKSSRKIQNPIIENPVQPEIDSEKPKSSLEKVSGSSADDGLGQNKAISGEKVIRETNIMASKESNVVKNEPLPSASKLPNVADSEPPLISSRSLDTETTQVPLEVSTESKLSHGDQTVDEPKPSVENGSKDETTPVRNGDLSHKEDPASNQNNKSGKKSSNLAKQERPENGLQNSPTLPSYMAATESAKAKLRAQGSPRFSQDGVDKNSATRRHSLPSSTHNKISSESPRTQRAVHSGGKGSHKSEKSMSSSRDGNVKGPEWRR